MFIIRWLLNLLALIALLSPKAKPVREWLFKMFWIGVQYIVKYMSKSKG